MKILKLRAENFLSWRELELDFPEPLSVLIGRNGTGKSSILDAFRVALTGTCRGVARKDAADLATWGSGKPWSVEIAVEHNKTVRTIRRTASTLNTIGEDGTRFRFTEEEIAQHIAERKVLDACLDVTRALDMTPDERKALIFRLARIELTDDALAKAGLDDPDVRAAALDNDWRKAERIAAERKRAHNNHAESIRPSPPQDRPLANGTTLSSVSDATLDASRRTIASLKVREGELVSTIAAARAGASATIDAFRTEFARLTKDLAGIDTANAEAARAELKKTIDSAIRVGTEAQKNVDAKRAAENAANKVAEEAQRAHNALVAAARTHECPVCQLEHEAPDKPSPDAIRAAAESLDRAKASATAAAKAAADAWGDVENASKTIRAAEAEDRRHAEPIVRASELRRQMKAVEARIAKAEADAKAGDPKPMEEELATTRERIGRGEALVLEVEQYRNAAKTFEAQTAAAKAARTAAESCERQERLCRPDGLQETLLAPVLEPVRKSLARWAPLLAPYSVRLTDSATVLVTGPSGEACVSLLSGSERWRVSLALSDALAQLSGLRFLALDETTLLDAGNRDALVKSLRMVAGDYDQVVIVGVLGDRAPKQAPAGSGIRVYMVGDGKVTPVAGANA